jgi:flavin-dependent thymidylate synthase
MDITNFQDPYFRVDICEHGSSPAPDKSIWRAQHVCVAEGYAMDAPIPANPADAIIRHQLKVKHWSVLEFGYVVLHFQGFPHDTVMQIVRHQDSKPLVQSMRYTGKRIIDCADSDDLNIEEIFYAQPMGVYATRTGGYVVSAANRDEYLLRCLRSCKAYRDAILRGYPEELARRELLSGYRQNFTMAGSVRAVFHWLDQRTLADTQIEAQVLAQMALQQLERWSPELFGWYRENRAGKNQLSP